MTTTTTPHPGTVAWLTTTTMADADHQYRRGGISQAAFDAYRHLWRTATYRFSNEAKHHERHPTNPETVAWIDALNERAGEPTCCTVDY